MSDIISGYIIVRKSQYEEAFPGGPALEPFNGVHYNGVDRSIWADIEAFFMKEQTPQDMRLSKNYQAIKGSGYDASFFKIEKSINTVRALAQINAEIYQTNEILAVSSRYLNQIKHEKKAEGPITWLGYDIILLGGWSLVRHGIFENRLDSLIEKSSSLNPFGLFDNTDFLDHFLSEYHHLATIDKVDPLPPELILDYVRVGTISDK